MQSEQLAITSQEMKPPQAAARPDGSINNNARANTGRWALPNCPLPSTLLRVEDSVRDTSYLPSPCAIFSRPNNPPRRVVSSTPKTLAPTNPTENAEALSYRAHRDHRIVMRGHRAVMRSDRNVMRSHRAVMRSNRNAMLDA
jgi:hypothetical protein